VSANDTANDRADWSVVSAGWDANRDFVEALKADLTDRMIELAQIEPGQRVLELGAGTGELARRLAAVVGATGGVVATDHATGMVDLIARTTADLPHVEAARVDACDIPYGDASFDVVVFRFGLMFASDPAVAFAEIRRVLKPGGRLVATTWAAPEHNMWLVSVGMSAMLTGLVCGKGPTQPGGPLSLGEPELLEKLAVAAGFDDAQVEAIDTPFRIADTDAHIAHVTSMAPPIAVGYANATEDARATFRASVADLTKQFQTADGLVLPGRALLLVAG
jgi:SAM-dependent methyltransferase